MPHAARNVTAVVPAPIVLGNHRWLVSATIAVSDAEAEVAEKRRTFTAGTGRRVTALETYCANCRRTYETAAGTVCEVGQVLRGGPINKRKKREPAEGSDVEGS